MQQILIRIVDALTFQTRFFRELHSPHYIHICRLEFVPILSQAATNISRVE